MPEWASVICTVGNVGFLAAIAAELLTFIDPKFARWRASRFLARAYARDNYRKAYAEEIAARKKEFEPRALRLDGSTFPREEEK